MSCMQNIRDWLDTKTTEELCRLSEEKTKLAVVIASVRETGTSHMKEKQWKPWYKRGTWHKSVEAMPGSARYLVKHQGWVQQKRSTSHYKDQRCGTNSNTSEATSALTTHNVNDRKFVFAVTIISIFDERWRKPRQRRSFHATLVNNFVYSSCLHADSITTIPRRVCWI